MGGTPTATATVPVWVDGLDGTTARSVSAFLDAHPDHPRSDRSTAAVLLIDLDQPRAADELAEAAEGQVVVGVGFGEAPEATALDGYLRKPLSGPALLVEIDRVVAGGAAGAAPGASTGRRRVSHGRDVFWAGGAEPSRRPRLRTTPTGPLDRTVLRRSAALAHDAVEGATTTSAAEALGRRRPVERVPDLGPVGPDEPAARYQPGAHLDGVVGRALARFPGEPWRLEGPQLALTADPDRDVVVVSADERALRRACATPLGDGWRLHRRAASPGHPSSAVVPIPVLRWDLAVWCAQGRLPVTVAADVPVRLTAWPDLTRVVLTPGVVAVVALLTSEAVTPADLPAATGLPPAQVFSVLAAAAGVGLLAPAERFGDDAATTTTADPDRAGVVGRLLGRLRAA